MKFNKGIYYAEIREITYHLIQDIRHSNLDISNDNEAIKEKCLQKLNKIVGEHNWIDNDYSLTIICHSNSYDLLDVKYNKGILEDALNDGGIKEMHAQMAYLLLMNDLSLDLDEMLEFPLKPIKKAS